MRRARSSAHRGCSTLGAVVGARERSVLMRIAAFNVENLFDRPRVMNLPTWTEGRRVLQAYARLSELFQLAVYSDDDKAE